MSLGIAVLDDDQHVIRSVPLVADDHAAFMTIVAREELALLCRLKDYEEDAEIFVPEFDVLRSDLSVASVRCVPGSTLHLTLVELEKLRRFASDRARSIIVLAD